ncbi:hypothetical protein K431DRAFT_251916 [Polychaeton citri CBS 116435]|uniref:Pescadillo homolog n=1 Tax=Polychaeton citri CBS 116435 TaxID=1314669 RepID=A0A9P4Q232_9PEZI|nr:hypothetical protein K431DRAFT_251916 [Polychaeton citri CBS 116435]
MGKIKKKGTSGASKNYITRSQAVRKLQVSLADFRRLCIFKGIYPREPTSRKRASKSATPSTTFYYTKDIQFLLHEPLLNKFRDQKSLAKKISKALGRNEVGEAKRFEENGRVRLRLDHIIKERYPTFVDALRDLDDALSMLFLFANLPSTLEVPAKTIAKCQRLTREFEWYLIRTHSLRKSFLSIKGIYYQATIQGQDVLWLVPYRFVQRAGAEVDFRIMATFVDFYTTLLGFVNFRLYTSLGLVYPPRFDQSGEEQGAELGAIQLEGQNEQAQIEPDTANGEANKKAQAEADRLLLTPSNPEEQEPQSSYQTTPETAEENGGKAHLPTEAALDEFEQIDAAADTLDQPSLTADATSAGKLFEPHTIFLSRETPRHSLELLLKAFGCKRVGWDSTLGGGAYCSEDDTRITHQIVDRPDLPLLSPSQTDGKSDEVDDDGEKVVKPRNARVPGRIYVQPQWVWDSINNGKLQRPDLYAPGAELPPHLSPWVKPRKGEYDPRKTLEEQEEEGEAEAAELEDEEEDEEEQEATIQNKIDDLGNGVSDEEEVESDDDGGMQVTLAASDSEDDEADSDNDAGDNGSFGGFSEREDEESEPSAAQQHQAELEAEAKGRSVGTNGSTKSSAKKQVEAKKAAKERKEREELEDVERRKMMMPRRKRKMYEKMVYSNARKDEKAEALRSKRRRIEAQNGKRA